MNNLKKIVAVLAITSMVGFSVPAGATTAEELTAQIAQLQRQLAALQAQAGTPAAACTFTRNLSVGARGADVKCLQEYLIGAGQSIPAGATGFFGPQTRAAVTAWQTAQGISPAAGFFGPISRAKYTTLVAAEPEDEPAAGRPADRPAAGTEGSFTVRAAASPASNANVTDFTNVPIYGIEVKATGSDIEVGRIDLRLAVTRAGNVVHPATLIKDLMAYDGTTLLTEEAITTADVSKEGANYFVRLTGIDFNVPAGQTKTLTIKANFIEGLETDRVLTVRVHGTTGIRAVDTLGLNSWQGLTTNRVHTIKYAAAGDSELTATVSVDNPKATTVKVHTTTGAEDVPMLMFNLRSTVGASKVTEVRIRAAGTAVTHNELTAVKLYRGATLLGSSSLIETGGIYEATFSDLSVDVAKDTTVTLTARADFSAIATGVASRDARLNLPVGGVTYEKPDLTTGTTPGAVITGELMRLFPGQVAVFTLTDTRMDYAVNSQTPSESTMNGVITFKVVADGGTLTALTAGNIDVRAYRGDVTVIHASPPEFISQTPTGNIPDGGEATVNVNVSLVRGTNSGFVYFKIDGITWTVGTATVTQTWGLEDFKTGARAW